ncbi:MAG: hypothetical protein LUD51_08265 [Clostridia bacterium]|nr:hypothetical protein [Clostridia bacterium]
MDMFKHAVCNEQGHLFEIFWGIPYESEELVKNFMNCEISEGLDRRYCPYQWLGEAYLFEEFLKTNIDAFIPKTKEYNKEALYWMGYIYRYWHFYTGENSREIYKQTPFRVMCDHYYIFHTMAPQLAIDNLKEIYQYALKRESGGS